MSTPSIPAIFVILPLLLLVIGAIFTFVGWRGRTIDNHPICRKCGFDLYTLDQATRCPECGIELSAKSIRLGNRRLRRWAVGLGLVVLLPSLLALSGILFAVAKHMDVRTFEPVSWLLEDGSAPAVAELKRRLFVGNLSGDAVDRIIRKALLMQADRNRPWQREWGEFIETARDLRKLPDDQWRQYVIQAPVVSLKVASPVFKGKRIGFAFSNLRARLGRKSLVVRYRDPQWQIGDYNHVLNDLVDRGALLDFNSAGGMGAELTLSPDTEPLSPGEHTLHVTVRYEIADSTDGPTVATAAIEVSAPFRFVSPATRRAVTTTAVSINLRSAQKGKT